MNGNDISGDKNGNDISGNAKNACCEDGIRGFIQSSWHHAWRITLSSCYDSEEEPVPFVPSFHTLSKGLAPWGNAQTALEGGVQSVNH